MTLDSLRPFLGDIDAMLTEVQLGRSSYVCPALTNLGGISLVLLREVVAPVLFRGADPEISDMMLTAGHGASRRMERHVFARANKFTYAERRRGLHILRSLGCGGTMPQNKSAVPNDKSPGDVFDLNTLVFGDSASLFEKGKERVLPVKRAVMYGSAISVQRYEDSTDSAFHNRATESGVLFNDETKKNSDNIFSRHWITPGTILVQTLSSRGRLLPMEGLRHLLLCLGEAGTYGGQTSLSGTNIRTHVVGVYASVVERANTVPEEIVKVIRDQGLDGLPAIRAAVDAEARPGHELVIPGAAVEAEIDRLQTALAAKDPTLAESYRHAATRTKALFDAWFVRPPKKDDKTEGSGAEDGKAEAGKTKGRGRKAAATAEA